MPTFSDLARAAFCLRQLYYARRDDDREPPRKMRERIALAFKYDELIDAPDRRLRRLPIERRPAAYRRNLGRLSERGDWSSLADPDETRAYLEGKDCRGVVHKVIEGDGGSSGEVDDDEDEGDRDGDSGSDEDDDPPIPSIVSPGTPPEEGVWESQSVRAVAAAKALAWEREQEIPRALVEYPAHAVVREVRLGTRRKAAYRRVLRAVRSLDGPPPRRHDARCESCGYRTECGVKTRSLASKLGL